LFLTLIALLK